MGEGGPHWAEVRLDISRAPNEKERIALGRRRDRLARMNALRTVDEACDQLSQLVASGPVGPLEELRLLDGFVRLDVPLAPDASDRSAPKPEHRPSSTRLMSPNGIALPFELIALLEAQSRTAPGDRAVGTETPLRRATGTNVGWCDYIASTATASGSGKHRMGVLDKKLRQLQKTLDRLADENLVQLPNRNAGQGKHEGFILLSEDGVRRRTNALYSVPVVGFFTVPVSLFTNGWVHVLEDSELALLLIAARLRQKYGDVIVPLEAAPRLLHYGLSRDAFEAHNMLDRLGLLEVEQDSERHADGKVRKYLTRGARPHGLRFLPAGLDKPALPSVAAEVQRRLDQTGSELIALPAGR